MKTLKFIVAALILSGTAYVSITSYLPARVDAGLNVKVAQFPMQIGDWSAREIEVSERDYEILETRNLFVREYSNARGESVVLYVVYSEDNRKVSHPPEICLMGSGLTIVNKSQVVLDESLPSVKLLVEDADGQEIVVYWYKAGELYTDQYLKQQLKIVLDRIFAKRTSGALIRLSTELKGMDGAQAIELLARFAAEIKPLLAKYIP